MSSKVSVLTKDVQPDEDKLKGIRTLGTDLPTQTISAKNGDKTHVPKRAMMLTASLQATLQGGARFDINIQTSSMKKNAKPLSF